MREIASLNDHIVAAIQGQTKADPEPNDIFQEFGKNVAVRSMKRLK